MAQTDQRLLVDGIGHDDHHIGNDWPVRLIRVGIEENADFVPPTQQVGDPGQGDRVVGLEGNEYF
ncbi:hypothetical protein [Streptomyces sp. NPDC018352]|uniref:hypothetical protein n=1 Tax=Streptomyces sp. NPDC018352 TaxID=3157194 RepID=UPI0033C11B34